MAGCIDIVTGYQDYSPLKNISTNYTSLMKYLLYDNNPLGWSQDSRDDIWDRMFILKFQCIEIFQKHFDTGIHTLNLNLIDHQVEYLSMFWIIILLVLHLTSTSSHYSNSHISLLPKGSQQQWRAKLSRTDY